MEAMQAPSSLTQETSSGFEMVCSKAFRIGENVATLLWEGEGQTGDDRYQTHKIEFSLETPTDC
jgi:hypothetical protein